MSIVSTTTCSRHLGIVIALGVAASASATSIVTVNPAKDSTTVLRNPLMNLTTYYGDYGNWLWNPDWPFGDPHVPAYTNILYMRTAWSALEPTEGNYAWAQNADYMKMLKVAKDKGFRVAFRVMVQDDEYAPEHKATPKYVWDAIRAAGQDSVMRGGNPNGTFIDITNAIWQQKFKTFVAAFGKRFDDPSITDYIDVNGLGGSGEGNPWLEGFADVDKGQAAYMDWHVGVYDQAFKHVVLDNTMPWNPDIDLKYGLSYRRDGLGSLYVSDFDIEFMQKQNLSETALLGEKCYSVTGANDSLYAWGADPKVIALAAPNPPTMGTYLDLIMNQAFAMHANTLNLQEDVWFTRYPDRLARLIANLGYRLRPSVVQYPSDAQSLDTMVLQHTWVNDAAGALPNDNRRWNRKYAVAFALFKNGELVPTKVVIDTATNPGVFQKNIQTTYASKIQWDVPAGQYQLGVGILDKTRPNDSSLALAIANPTKRHGWYVLGNLNITGTPSFLWVSDMPVMVTANGWGTVHMDSSIVGNALTLQGTTYAKGIGVHAASNILVPLDKNYARFKAKVGVDDEINGGGAVIFQVWGDGQKLFESQVLHGGEVPVPVDISVENISQLTLSALNAQNGIGNDHADWVLAQVTLPTTAIKKGRERQAYALSAWLQADALVVDRTSIEPVALRLFSLDGTLVFKSTISGQHANLAIHAISRGVYLLQAHSGTETLTQRLVKN